MPFISINKGGNIMYKHSDIIVITMFLTQKPSQCCVMFGVDIVVKMS